MSNEQEGKKLNRLNINKETVSDLDVPEGQDVVGGAGSTSPQACIPKSAQGPAPRCGSTNPILCIKAPPGPAPSVYC